MRRWRLDTFDLLQVVGLPAAFVLLWYGWIWMSAPHIMPVVEIAVAVAAAWVALALIVWTWSRVGGHDAYRSLRRWVSGGPDPDGVSTEHRLRYLKPIADGSGALGWGYLLIAAIWVLLGIWNLVQGDRSGFGNLVVAVIWVGLAVVRLVDQRWRHRAELLYNRTLTRQGSEANAAV
jgi:hypothetical protein